MKRPLTDSDIVGALEAFGAMFPWDTVDIWISREPSGAVSFTAHLPSNNDFGAGYVFGHGKTAMEAVENCKKDAGIREPEAAREAKVRELQAQIAKLNSVVIGPPPYKPGTYLTNGATTVEAEPAMVETL